ncbi:MAG: saccharopine dehydrogenase NADP-binding domain-containing protein [Bacteroidetes bacterium]|nr:saccharopine dehydrogenase NADP-binding domain-containing protein [Bacteroidota bacterium]MBP6639229.1 saccharopine dehydrogenase NADP-binding domain-containing protein [Bacteroidia bacterium]
MKRILVIGAGRSATTMIQYLLDHAESGNWEVVVGDMQEELALEKVGNHPRGKGIYFDATDEAVRKEQISKSDLVISLLPPTMHVLAAHDCLALKTHLVTASYVSDEMASLDAAAKAADLIFLNEVGVDPGIDHMSTMEMIERVREQGGKISSFRSYCGALVAPECKNEWGYKFTWAPRNVILAGQGVARYRRDGAIRYLPYHRLFERIEEIEVPGTGVFDAYANRDSVKYLKLYNLEEVDTLYRATLRFPGYCQMWNAFVQMGMTDGTYRLPDSKGMTYRDFTFSFVHAQPGLSDRESLAFFLDEFQDGEVLRKLEHLDLLSDRKIELENASPAEILEAILLEKWVFEPNDVDMVVMQHQLDYELNGIRRKLVASMVDKGRDQHHTSISRTVGLPAAIAAKHILAGNIQSRGVLIPTVKDIYAPILQELEDFDIRFTEQEFLVAAQAVV